MKNNESVNKFKKKSFLEIRKMTLEELNAYYRSMRKYNHDKNIPIKGIELRKKFHPVIHAIIKGERLALGHSLTIVGDERTKSDKPRIYAVTHSGRYDIETILEIIKESAFYVWGDPGELYRSPLILLQNAIGMIFVDTDNREDRHISLETMVKILKQNGNEIIHPEGAWNTTENEIVTKLYTGVIEAAIRGNAEIVPVAIENYGKKYYAKIGKNIDCSNMSLENKREEADNLRDVIATLKWDIWEKYSNYENGTSESRSELPYDYSDQFLDQIMADSDNGYTIEMIERTRFNDKSITPPAEAYDHLADIAINENTSFLFDDMSHGDRQVVAKVLKKRY